MENREMIANTEILNILKNIEPEYVYVLPIELIEYLNNNSLKDESEKYSGFNENGDIEVSDEAEEILTFLYLNYWAEENEKKEFSSYESVGSESAGGAAQEKDIKTRRKNPVRTGDDSEPLVLLILLLGSGAITLCIRCFKGGNES